LNDLAKSSELGCATTTRLLGARSTDEFDIVFGGSTLELADAYPLSAMIVWPCRPVQPGTPEGLDTLLILAGLPPRTR